ncbi:acetolactate synthase small subunit [bacterium]|jgi:acetolactate synthase-1/3 small subunit|nr:acetolactate synthase small subunit [Gemmatimonadota bacterium]MCH2663053.1 acetolactate synthase small subunit [bacterium]HCK09198.1 acetolactate synthase small subunit [Candidatus Latescibacterota bacterium]
MLKRHTISALVENHFGVLCRIAGLFSSRGFNIDSLSVGETEDPEISRMTIVVKGDDRVLEQVVKQLNRLIDVIKVIDITHGTFIERELALIKVKTDTLTRSEVIQITEVFRANIVDVSTHSMTIEATGKVDKINAMITMLSQYGITEMARTGNVALLRDSQAKADTEQR